MIRMGWIWALLILLHGCGGGPNQDLLTAPWATYTTDRYTVEYPQAWIVHEDSGAAIRFSHADSVDSADPDGGINILGRYYHPGEVFTLLPNHSQRVAIFELDSPHGPVRIFELERSVDQRRWREQYAYIPGASLYFEIWLKTEAADVPTLSPLLARMIQKFKPQP